MSVHVQEQPVTFDFVPFEQDTVPAVGKGLRVYYTPEDVYHLAQHENEVRTIDDNLNFGFDGTFYPSRIERMGEANERIEDFNLAMDSYAGLLALANHAPDDPDLAPLRTAPQAELFAAMPLLFSPELEGVNWLKGLRQASANRHNPGKPLTQLEIHRATGISNAYLSRIERDERQPEPEVVSSLLAYFAGMNGIEGPAKLALYKKYQKQLGWLALPEIEMPTYVSVPDTEAGEGLRGHLSAADVYHIAHLENDVRTNAKELVNQVTVEKIVSEFSAYSDAFLGRVALDKAIRNGLVERAEPSGPEAEVLRAMPQLDNIEFRRMNWLKALRMVSAVNSRDGKPVTQEQLAKAAGLSHSYVSQIEKGNRTALPETAADLLRSISDLHGLSDGARLAFFTRYTEQLGNLPLLELAKLARVESPEGNAA